MAMDFSGSAGAATPFDLMPNGQLAWAIINLRGIKASASGGGYLDLELTLDDGQPFARKKLWDMIGDPQNTGNTEKYREMGTIAITRILECGRNAGPNNLPGYQIADYQALNGLRVAIKIGIEKGTNGHPDKNKVAEYLTPNPASQSGHKGYAMLMAGTFNAAPATAPGGAQSGFGGASTPAAATTTGFGGAASPAPVATGGFGTGGVAAAGAGFPAAAANAATSAATPTNQTGFVQTGPVTTTSPSDPGATPNWLAQANQ